MNFNRSIKSSNKYLETFAIYSGLSFPLSISTINVFSPFILLLLLVQSVNGDSDVEMCDRGLVDIWTNDFESGEKMYYATINICADPTKCEDPNMGKKEGNKVQSRCLAKGPQGKDSSEILDPYLRHDSVKMVFEFYSTSSCSAGGGLFKIPAPENAGTTSENDASCQRRLHRVHTLARTALLVNVQGEQRIQAASSVKALALESMQV